MLWTKNGSIPYESTDGTEGWQPAPDKPDAPEGKEVIWVAPQWIVRDPAPANREGYQWAYFLNEGWVELPSHETAHDASVVTDNTSVATDPFISLTSSQLG